MLNPEKFSDKSVIHEGLKHPYLIIENALLPEIAEQLYSDLIQSEQWCTQDHRNDLPAKEQEIQNDYQPDYTFSRDKITLGTDRAPESVNKFFEYLRSPEMLSYFSDVSGRPCDDFQLSATLFREGNHIAEHNDYYVSKRQDGSTVTRTLTFNYYLTKNWKPEWGGRFVWKNPYTEITPTFNTLVLFKVGGSSHHYVEAVRRNALEPRIALTGWYFTIRKPGRKINI